jgi:hypothetical protein
VSFNVQSFIPLLVVEILRSPVAVAQAHYSDMLTAFCSHRALFSIRHYCDTSWLELE